MTTLEVKQAHLQIERMIEKVVTNFHHKNGGDRDELLAEAKLIWLKALPHYDSTRSKITTFSWIVIWRGLISYNRKVYRRHSRESVGTIDYPLPDHSNSGFLRSLLFEVSEDARIIVEMILDTPRHLGTWLNSQWAMRQILPIVENRLHGMGWDSIRIENRFQEIREALQ